MDGEMMGKKVKTTINGSMSHDGNSMHEDFMQSLDEAPATKTMTIDYKRVGKAMAANRRAKIIGSRHPHADRRVHLARRF